MKRRRSYHKGGFSLLELMVVVSIIGLVTGVVVASFSGGIRVWESARVLTHVEQELYFAVESVRKDLVNTYRFHGISFSGAEREVSFPALLLVQGEDGLREKRVGSVKYLFNPADQTLNRYTWVFPGGEDGADREIVAGGIRGIRFSYLDGDGLDDEGAVLDIWKDPTNFPAVVTMDLIMDGGGAGSEVVIKRQFPLGEGLWRTD
jgi:prepilin-type N-terminal cleavage/methylation domain-containing protein